MFYLTSLSRNLSLNPQDLGTDIKSMISKKIRELEGTVVGNHGYIISIVEFDQEGKGHIDNETGRVNFTTNYKAITFKPVKNELMEAFPVYINEHGVFYKVGPLQIFVSQHSMGEGWKYDSEENIWTYGDNVIKFDGKNKIQIVAFRIDSNQITALGDLKI